MIIPDTDKARFVDVVVDTLGIGGSGNVIFRDVPVPITFAYLAEKLVESGE